MNNFKNLGEIIDFESMWKSIESFFSSDGIGNLISFLVLIITIVGGLVTHLHNRKSITVDVKNAREALNNKSLHTQEQIKAEPLFFDEPLEKSYLFYKKIVVNNKGRRIQTKKLRKESYLLTGDAGCGKSALLKHDFLQNFSLKKRRKKTGFIFLNSSSIIDLIDKQTYKTEFTDMIKNAKYKSIYLFLDGVDEIGETRCVDLYELIDCISKLTPNIIFKISCRTEFAQKHLERENRFWRIHKHLEIGTWTPKMLRSFAKQIIKHIPEKQYQSTRNLTDIERHMVVNKSWEKYITSPLLMKFYIYIKLQGYELSIEEMKNKFSFYDRFVYELIGTYHRRKDIPLSPDDIELLKQKHAKIVFNAFSNEKKDLENSSDLVILAPILKSSAYNKKTFVHETFFEYYVAYYYYIKVTNPASDSFVISVFSQNYSNDFSDFITDAMVKNNTDKYYIFNKLRNIYFYTLNEKTKQIFRQKFPEISIDTICQLSNLSERDFFSLKYEIIFRLGRLNSIEEEDINNEIIRFLEFVYYNDDNIKYSRKKKYFHIVLKRCCAISSSFLGGEKIEIDYVKHMLSTPDSDYDLANRSHTLLFYGDVKNTSIFDFFDNKQGSPCERAFQKRISRLAYTLPENIDCMEGKIKKKYFFRLFDLATIYTFMRNRQKALTEEEYKIISKCQVNFIGASTIRLELMNKIKNAIISLNHHLNVKNS